MKKNTWKIASILLLILLVCTPKEQTKGKATDFTLTSIDGEEYTLSKLEGRVVLIDFWATWCPPCRSSIPVFVNLYDKFSGQGFIVLGISREEKEILNSYKDENRIPYPILIDDKNVAKSYGVQAIPNIFIIDKKGKVRKTQVGFSPELEAMFEAFIDTLLRE